MSLKCMWREGALETRKEELERKPAKRNWHHRNQGRRASRRGDGPQWQRHQRSQQEDEIHDLSFQGRLATWHMYLIVVTPEPW